MTDQIQNQTDNNQTDQADEPQPTRLQMLKKRADLMGITYSNNIGEDALSKKIQNKLNGEQAINIQEANQALESGAKSLALGEDLSQLSPAERLRREQMALVRCRITNLDPKKKDLPGEIFTVANRVLGTVRKFIPYGEVTENGYHIPRVLYNELASRKFCHITSTRDPRTKTPVIGQKWVKEFSLEVLEPLTQEELNRLATAQVAAGTATPIGELA